MDNQKKFLQLNTIGSYRRAFNLSNYVWEIILDWEWFERKTVGSQFVTAVDSISATLAEGFGRYGKKDKIKFYYYSFGSLKESFDWNEKAKIRGLLTEKHYQNIFTELQELPKEIHQLTKFTNEKLKQ